MDQKTKEEYAGHFLTLLRVWDAWIDGDTAVIPPETEQFFIELTDKYFRDALSTKFKKEKGRLEELGGNELQGEAAWQCMRAYFNVKRPRAKYSILHSIFAEAQASAARSDSGDDEAQLSDIIFILLNRYKLQCRSAVRDFWAPEALGTTGQRWNTESGDAPVQSERGESRPRSKFDLLQTEAATLSPEEENEYHEIAQSAANAFFPSLSDSQKAGLYAIFCRNNAGEKLLYNDSRIGKFVDVKQAQFYEGRRKAIKELIESFRDGPIWENEDNIGRIRLEILLEEKLLDESFEWFHRKTKEEVPST